MKSYIKLLSAALLVAGVTQGHAMDVETIAKTIHSTGHRGIMTGAQMAPFTGGLLDGTTRSRINAHLEALRLDELKGSGGTGGTGGSGTGGSGTGGSGGSGGGSTIDKALAALSITGDSALVAKELNKLPSTAKAAAAKLTVDVTPQAKQISSFAAALGAPFADSVTPVAGALGVNGMAVIDAIQTVLGQKKDLLTSLSKSAKATGTASGAFVADALLLVDTEIQGKLSEVLTNLVNAEYERTSALLKAGKAGKRWAVGFTDDAAMPTAISDALKLPGTWSNIVAAYNAL